MDTFRALQRLISPIITRVRRVCLGAIIRRVDDGGDLQRMQVESIGHSVYDNVEKFEQFGFTSNPPVGLDAIIIERCGKHIIVAIGDRKYRIKNLESGDTAVYDVRGQTIILNETGISVTDAHGNTVITDSNGINTTDTNGNNAKMDGSGINLTDINGNNITMAASGVNINGVLITQAGVVTTPATVTTGGALTAGGAITSGGDVTSSSGKTLDTHTHEIAQTLSITGASTSGPTAITATTTPPTA